ncbi:MAG: hypothetical protein IKB09_09750 [Oscillospiraceae bacterium]|nr:hypothetical protein [Oscillospiraceae bacterium]
MTKLVKESLQEGAALEQSIGGIETLFGAGGKNLQEYADSIGKSAGDAREEYEKLIRAQEEVFFNAENAYKTAGLSANEYMETVTGFSASLISSLGGDTEKAAAVADMALVDMADNFNKMGTEMSLIQNAYQGFAKQNYTMLDNLKLGYGGTKEEMQRLLADAQKLTGVEYDIGNLADVYSAIHAIQGELGLTGATALESSTTLTGSFNSMKAAYKNLLADLTLGRPLDKSLNAVKETTVTFLKDNLWPAIKNIFSSLPEIGAMIWGEITDGCIIEWLKTEISNLGSLDDSTLGSLMNIGGQLINTVASGAAEVFPELVKTLISLPLTVIDYIAENIDSIIAGGIELAETALNGVWNSVKAIAQSLFQENPIKTKIGIIAEGYLLGFEFTKAAADGALGGVSELLPNRGGYTGSNVDGFYINGRDIWRYLGGSHANGLDYVPYDGYLAELHEGEMVLTRAKANAVRRGRATGGGIVINQYFYDKYKTAADQQAAARYEQEKAVMGFV